MYVLSRTIFTIYAIDGQHRLQVIKKRKHHSSTGIIKSKTYLFLRIYRIWDITHMIIISVCSINDLNLSKLKGQLLNALRLLSQKAVFILPTLTPVFIYIFFIVSVVRPPGSHSTILRI